MSHLDAARFSFADAAGTVSGRALIRMIETAGGRHDLVRRVAGHEADLQRGEDFWRLMVLRCGLSLDCIAGSLDDIPNRGPLVVVANHPRGLLDTLVMSYILSGLRRDFRILDLGGAKSGARMPALAGWPAAINAGVTETATFLHRGGAVGLFPGGPDSTPFGAVYGSVAGSAWRRFPARLIARSGATVVPLWFDGSSSWLMQVAGGLHETLRMGLQLREVGVRVDTPVRIAIGRPIGPRVLADMAGDSKQMMEFLRRATYSLSPTPSRAA